MKILGFRGRAQAGKDTCCDMIIEMAEPRAKKLSLAQPLKELCADVFGLTYDMPPRAFFGDGTDKDQEYPNLPGWNGRKILQFIGTEGFRKVSTSIWVDHLIRRMHSTPEVELFLISDVRFEDEISALKKLDATIVRVTRPGAPSILGIPGHSSEPNQEELYADLEICNDGTLEELREKLKQLL
jgi:hypothetical protein